MHKYIFFGMIFILLFTGCSDKNIFQKKIYKSSSVYSPAQAKQHTRGQYHVRAYDRLAIKFYYYPELSTQNPDIGIAVSPQGYINMPLVGQIKVISLTTTQIQKRLEDRYSKYLTKKPAIKVDILHQKVYVVGEVKDPGAIDYLKNPYITPLKAISQRGGLGNFAKRDIIFIIKGTRENHKVIKLDLTNANSVNMFNTILEPEDIVYVASNSAKNFNNSMGGINNSLSLINTIFSAIITYKSVTD